MHRDRIERPAQWIMALALGLGACTAITGCFGDDPVLPDAGVHDYQLVGDLLTCLPDGDGQIARDEVNFVAGLSADYLVNPPGTVATFDAKGKLIDNRLEWDFSDSQGVVARVPVEAPGGKWFSASFPSATLAIPTTAAGDTLQLLQVDEDRVLLLGLASRAKDRTLTVYEPPVVAMRFPLKAGLTFASSAKLKEGSKIDGLPVFSEDTYNVRVDAEGSLRLPYLRLGRVLRIQTEVTIKTVGGVTKTTRQLQWFAECYGEVVRALSVVDEKDPLFSKATELRRLAL